MKLATPLTAILIATALAGCAGSSGSSVNLPLTATRQNTGQIGNVTLSDWGQQTNFSFFISGAPSGASLPLRLYAFVNKGGCQQPGAVAYALNDRVSTERQAIRGWTFSRSAPVPLSQLLSGDYSVVVRTAATDGSVDIFCADLHRSSGAK
ncbi:hypothetical protein [Pseudomonas sp.]|jgi:hypothetical protein|uniref:hypothetical protein n=1 Tax=Pseudomonas sp. TaxID=306 RepID=UPI002E300F66|nr:hypothetical protein [Pseudomonas sp.]HEX4551141.1 hypothetical protein [Pseudomonas sp.]